MKVFLTFIILRACNTYQNSYITDISLDCPICPKDEISSMFGNLNKINVDKVGMGVLHALKEIFFKV